MSHVFTRALHFAGSLFLLVLLLPSCATIELDSTPVVRTVQDSQYKAAYSRHPGQPVLRVMTLNIAHGRGTGFHQLFLHPGQTRVNLDNIATLLNDTAADIIALQEADAPSFWSGNFNHVDYLAHRSGFYHIVQAPHVDAIGLSYGTALMSRLTLSNPQAITFDPALSAVPKGFIVSTINWPGTRGLEIDIISVHLDFMSRSVREKQAEELIRVVRARDNPVIIMGDLNTGWHQQDSTTQYLSRELGLTAFQPQNDELVTFPALGERLDWILVSPGLEFHSHDIIGNGVSDHRGVVADIVLSGRHLVDARD